MKEFFCPQGSITLMREYVSNSLMVVCEREDKHPMAWAVMPQR